jgi:hypothetical protein
MNEGLPIVENLGDFGIMAAAGILVAAFFDIFRCLRRAIKDNGGKNNGFTVQFEDFTFALIAFLFVVLLVYKINDGILRSYIVAGFIVGIILYATILVRFSGKIFYWIFYGIVFCIKWAGKTIGAFLKAITRVIRKLWEKFKKSSKKIEKN